MREGLIRETLKKYPANLQKNRPSLLHGDYWPGNILWKDGELRAVIDWEDAQMGDPLEDIANSRLEILWALGKEAMDLFTELYRTQNPIDFTHLPYWDLCAALRPASKISTWGLDLATENAMQEKHYWFVNQALDKLITNL